MSPTEDEVVEAFRVVVENFEQTIGTTRYNRVAIADSKL